MGPLTILGTMIALLATRSLSWGITSFQLIRLNRTTRPCEGSHCIASEDPVQYSQLFMVSENGSIPRTVLPYNGNVPGTIYVLYLARSDFLEDDPKFLRPAQLFLGL